MGESAARSSLEACQKPGSSIPIEGPGDTGEGHKIQKEKSAGDWYVVQVPVWRSHVCFTAWVGLPYPNVWF